MSTQQTLLVKPRNSLSKTIWLVLSVVAVFTSSAIIASYFIQTSTTRKLHHVCHRALDTASCLAHVSEVAYEAPTAATKDHKFSLLNSFLMKSITHIQKAMDTAKAVKSRINNPREEGALRTCEELMESSMHRIWNSMVALTKDSTEDAHTWLSTVLTNHATCLDELEGTAKRLMESEIEELRSRARTSLAILVALLPPNRHDFIEEPLNGAFPSWVSREDRRLLESSAKDINANVVVAQDGSGDFYTLKEAVEAAPKDKSIRYVIHVKAGTYEEKVEIKRPNVTLVGDGMDSTIITGHLCAADVNSTFRSATVAATGDGFIAQDMQFKNTAGPNKGQAVALRVGADTSVINRCKIDGFQDSLYPHSNRQFYAESFVTGTVDFIFGFASVVFQNCKLVARKGLITQNNMYTAQGREDPNQNTGTSIQKCYVIPSTDLKPYIGQIKTYLGRPWRNFSRTVVMQSKLSTHIDPAGWAEWDDDHKSYLETLYYGEYKNQGPGAGTADRVTWPGYHIITSAEEASQFTVKNLIQGDQWLPNTGVNFIEGL